MLSLIKNRNNKGNSGSICLTPSKLSNALILFADDTVLFGKTPEILQHLLDKLFIYCRKWNIEVNIDKTKVIVFRNSWRPVTNHTVK
jgi:hypothetical protein